MSDIATILYILSIAAFWGVVAYVVKRQLYDKKGKRQESSRAGTGQHLVS